MGTYNPDVEQSLERVADILSETLPALDKIAENLVERLDTGLKLFERIAAVLEAERKDRDEELVEFSEEHEESLRAEGERRGHTNERASILTWLDRHPDATAKQAAEAIRSKLIGGHDATSPPRS